MEVHWGFMVLGIKGNEKHSLFLTSTRDQAREDPGSVEVRCGTREGGPGFRLLWCGIKVSARKERALEMAGGWCRSVIVLFMLLISFVCFGAA